jgi:hypothetical protein
MSQRVRLVGIVLLVALSLSRLSTPSQPPAPPETRKVTQVTYVYEKDDGPVPRPVEYAVRQLNKKGILGSIFEKDQRTGDGEVPEQYKIALEAGREAGLPSLVVQAKQNVLKIVKGVTTEQHVMDAVEQDNARLN